MVQVRTQGAPHLEVLPRLRKEITNRESESIMTKQEAAENLQKAVVDFIVANGGSPWVVGGVQVIQFPDDLKYNWSLAIKVTGKKPSPQPAQP